MVISAAAAETELSGSEDWSTTRIEGQINKARQVTGWHMSQDKRVKPGMQTLKHDI